MSWRKRIQDTEFPQIVSAETILFWIWKLLKIQIVAANFNFLPNKLIFCCWNYMRKYDMYLENLFYDAEQSQSASQTSHSLFDIKCRAFYNKINPKINWNSSYTYFQKYSLSNRAQILKLQSASQPSNRQLEIKGHACYNNNKKKWNSWYIFSKILGIKYLKNNRANILKLQNIFYRAEQSQSASQPSHRQLDIKGRAFYSFQGCFLPLLLLATTTLWPEYPGFVQKILRKEIFVSFEIHSCIKIY